MNKTSVDNGEEPFEFEYLGYCDYPVSDPNSASRESSCGDHAIARGWWGNYDEAWLLCQEHLDFIIETEKTESQ